jgi:hypothetical protein
MNTFEIVNLIVFVAGFATVVKFLFGLQDKITQLEVGVAEFKVEVTKEISNLSIRVERLETKFGIVEERNANTKEQLVLSNQRVDKLEIEIKEIKIEQRDFMNRILDKMDLSKVAGLEVSEQMN